MSYKAIYLSRARRALPAIVAAACALAASSAQAQAVVAVRGDLPPPDPVALAAGQEMEYRIGPFDTLEISVFGVETLTRTVQVDTNGQINYPLLGAVVAATRTPHELAADIAARLDARYLQSPQVSVLVKASQSQKFTVEGAVQSPGVYDLQGRMTLLQAIATAKGLDELGKTSDVVVFRTIEGQRRAAVADLRAIRTGKVQDPQIYAGDLIVVSSSRSRTWLRNIMSGLPLFNLLRL